MAHTFNPIEGSLSSRLPWATQNWPSLKKKQARWWWFTPLIPVLGSHTPLVPTLGKQRLEGIYLGREGNKRWKETGVHWIQSEHLLRQDLGPSVWAFREIRTLVAGCSASLIFQLSLPSYQTLNFYLLRPITNCITYTTQKTNYKLYNIYYTKYVVMCFFLSLASH